MTNKRVLITGGTKGIGRAVAEVFATKGYDILLTYASDEVAAADCVRELQSRYNVTIDAIKADSTKQQAIDDIYDYINLHNITIDVVVMNAAITLRTSFEQTKFEDWDKVFFANVHFPVFLLQKILQNINKQGCVIFTGSLMGIHPHGTSLSYGVTKSATHATVRNLVKHLKPYKIRINGVAPGFVDTDWQKNKPAEIRRNIENKISLERFCLPQEVAEVYLMLAENEYFNGEIVKIDGGYMYQ